MGGGECDWYLAQLKPNSFKLAERALRRQGFNVFCPLLDAQLLKAGKAILTKKPLFPGYLFVSFDPHDAPWRAINSTYGVSRLVTFGSGHPPKVPKTLVDGLQSRCDESGTLLPVDALHAGDLIRILNGPFAQFVSRIESIGSDHRINFLVNILGRPTRVEVQATNVSRFTEMDFKV